MSEEKRKPATIRWYRTRIEKDEMSVLNERSDLLGLLQAGGHLGLMVLFGVLTVYFQFQGQWLLMIAGVLLYGIVSSFCVNAMHELVHGTVFKTKWLNEFFAKLFSFPEGINHKFFWLSHKAHHRYTLHQPDDLEVIEPEKHNWRTFFRDGIINLNPMVTISGFIKQWNNMRGRFDGEWDQELIANASEKERKAVGAWAAIIIFGHLAIAVGSIALGAWIVPIFFTFSRQFGGLPFMLCNSTQHAGLQDAVPDFRLCCRTIYLSPVLQFLYWHMNYHIEHHMYAAVPCYRLGRLHRAIKHELPHTPNGLVESWRIIDEIMQKQTKDPSYRFVPELPGRT